jgi:hypothetical protein
VVCLEDLAACFGFDTTSTTGTCALDDAINGGFWTNDAWSASNPDIADLTLDAIDSSTAAFGYGFEKGWFAAPSIYDTTILTKVNFVNF